MFRKKATFAEVLNAPVSIRPNPGTHSGNIEDYGKTVVQPGRGNGKAQLLLESRKRAIECYSPKYTVSPHGG